MSVPSRVATAYNGDKEESVLPLLIPPWISVDTFGLSILDSVWYSTDVAAKTSLLVKKENHNMLCDGNKNCSQLI
jgi:hypothetical protein